MNKYEIIANEMRDRIKNNVYPIDQPIPDEVSLAKEFNSSRMTMKRALDNLVAEVCCLENEAMARLLFNRQYRMTMSM